jgi:putative ABC transport system permease protein
MLFGLAPAFQNRHAALNMSLKYGDPRLGGPASGNVRDAFITLQVGLSLVLLIGASLLAQSFWKLIKSPFGFEPDQILTFQMDLPWSVNRFLVRGFYSEIQPRIESLTFKEIDS